MEITLRTPLFFSEIGNKDNQEDRLYPAYGATKSSRTFILCDGMGGHARGEVAAEVVSESLGKALDSQAATTVSPAEFEKALDVCRRALDESLPDDNDKRPGTTLTCLQFGDNGALVAHIGDSRIYQIRPGKGIMMRTEDHSLVNELVRAGQLTEAQARVHPRRNVITRAMMPGAKNPAPADVAVITDIQAGDYFLLCCDGVLERLSESALINIISDITLDDSGKLATIKALCDKGTRDNYTAWLVPVDTVTDAPAPGNPVITLETLRLQEMEAGTPATVEAQAVSANNKKIKGSLLVIGFVAIAAIIVYAIIMFSGSNDKVPESIETTPIPESVEAEAPTETNAASATQPAVRKAASDAARKQDNHIATPAAKTSEDTHAQEADKPAETKPATGAQAAAAAHIGRETKPATDPTPTEPEEQPAAPIID